MLPTRKYLVMLRVVEQLRAGVQSLCRSSTASRLGVVWSCDRGATPKASVLLSTAVTAFQMTCATASVLEPASVQSSLLASVVTVLLAATSNAVSR